MNYKDTDKYWRRITVGVLCAGLLAMTAWLQAAPVYRWTDAQGQIHYSDRPQPSSVDTAIATSMKPARTPAGLRSGERATLHAIEQRRQARHRQVETARREQRQARARHRQACRERRAQLRLGRRHGDGKALSKYLRANCW